MSSLLLSEARLYQTDMPILLSEDGQNSNFVSMCEYRHGYDRSYWVSYLMIIYYLEDTPESFHKMSKQQTDKPESLSSGFYVNAEEERRYRRVSLCKPSCCPRSNCTKKTCPECYSLMVTSPDTCPCVDTGIHKIILVTMFNIYITGSISERQY